MRKTAIITGASRGIGRAIATKFHHEGYNVVVNSINGGEKLDGLALEFNSKEPGTALAVKGDVSDSLFAAELVKEAVSHFGRVDVLINNAGVSYIGLIQDMTPEEWNRIIGVNLSSVHYMCSSVIPHMLNARTGRIINISSVWGNVGASCEVAYSASKGGVNLYTKALAKELAPSGIAVNAIACGTVDTDMNKCFSPDERLALEEEIPVGRFATPGEIAELVFSVSSQSEYLTGQIITADGGWT